jgi:hypothetical protein
MRNPGVQVLKCTARSQYTPSAVPLILLERGLIRLVHLFDDAARSSRVGLVGLRPLNTIMHASGLASRIFIMMSYHRAQHIGRVTRRSEIRSRIYCAPHLLL